MGLSQPSRVGLPPNSLPQVRRNWCPASRGAELIASSGAAALRPLARTGNTLRSPRCHRAFPMATSGIKRPDAWPGPSAATAACCLRVADLPDACQAAFAPSRQSAHSLSRSSSAFEIDWRTHLSFGLPLGKVGAPSPAGMHSTSNATSRLNVGLPSSLSPAPASAVDLRRHARMRATMLLSPAPGWRPLPAYRSRSGPRIAT